MTSQAMLKTEIQTEKKKEKNIYYANILERDKKGQGGRGGGAGREVRGKDKKDGGKEVCSGERLTYPAPQ